MAGVEVSKEYVRRQLQDMGITDISDAELEDYTRGSIELTPSSML